MFNGATLFNGWHRKGDSVVTATRLPKALARCSQNHGIFSCCLQVLRLAGEFLVKSPGACLLRLELWLLMAVLGYRLHTRRRAGWKARWSGRCNIGVMDTANHTRDTKSGAVRNFLKVPAAAQVPYTKHEFLVTFQGPSALCVYLFLCCGQLGARGSAPTRNIVVSDTSRDPFIVFFFCGRILAALKEPAKLAVTV